MRNRKTCRSGWYECDKLDHHDQNLVVWIMFGISLWLGGVDDFGSMISLARESAVALDAARLLGELEIADDVRIDFPSLTLRLSTVSAGLHRLDISSGDVAHSMFLDIMVEVDGQVLSVESISLYRRTEPVRNCWQAGK
jgi:hypothetical protein